MSGAVNVPGDKSISHRALVLGAMSIGETTIDGLLESEDVLATMHAMEALGCKITNSSDKTAENLPPEQRQRTRWHVNGLGIGGFMEPTQALDFGNSGTGVRLAMGAIATTGITATFTGDASLCSRPMERVLSPLKLLGATATGAAGGTHLPLTLTGAEAPLPVDYTVPVPSAQVKSAILLAALNAPGRSTVIEPVKTRDHTERMLKAFGANIHVQDEGDGQRIELEGYAELTGQHIRVPGDPSSAAFLAAAALLVPNSDVLIKDVLINPYRIGFYQTLQEMGADLKYENETIVGGEPVADIRVKYAPLSGTDVPAARAPSMIDEFPVLAVLSAKASGKTTMNGLAELRVKESDRLSAMASGLSACGVSVEEGESTLTVTGADEITGGNTISSHLDHRIAMSFLILGLASKDPICVKGCETIATSFPNFVDMMNSLGAKIETVGKTQ